MNVFEKVYKLNFSRWLPYGSDIFQSLTVFAPDSYKTFLLKFDYSPL